MMWKKAVVIGYINKSTACKAVPFSAAAGIKKKTNRLYVDKLCRDQSRRKMM